MFFRKSRLEPVPITMTGARMGERLLHIGVDDPGLIGALSKKVGLSGVAGLAVDNERDAMRARQAAAQAGVLIDVKLTPLRTLPFADASFDLVVVHSMRGLLARLDSADRIACLQDAYRVLRSGGRIVVIEQAPRAGLASLFRGHAMNEHYASGGGAEGALKAERFRPVRLLGEVDGYRFTEGLKT